VQHNRGNGVIFGQGSWAFGFGSSSDRRPFASISDSVYGITSDNGKSPLSGEGQNFTLVEAEIFLVER
jgi:hypothetical protein